MRVCRMRVCRMRVCRDKGWSRYWGVEMMGVER